jgi:chemotaxis protein histidine kinase CheA
VEKSKRQWWVSHAELKKQRERYERDLQNRVYVPDTFSFDEAFIRPAVDAVEYVFDPQEWLPGEYSYDVESAQISYDEEMFDRAKAWFNSNILMMNVVENSKESQDASMARELEETQKARKAEFDRKEKDRKAEFDRKEVEREARERRAWEKSLQSTQRKSEEEARRKYEDHKRKAQEEFRRKEAHKKAEFDKETKRLEDKLKDLTKKEADYPEGGWIDLDVGPLKNIDICAMLFGSRGEGWNYMNYGWIDTITGFAVLSELGWMLRKGLLHPFHLWSIIYRDVKLLRQQNKNVWTWFLKNLFWGTHSREEHEIMTKELRFQLARAVAKAKKELDPQKKKQLAANIANIKSKYKRMKLEQKRNQLRAEHEKKKVEYEKKKKEVLKKRKKARQEALDKRKVDRERAINRAKIERIRRIREERLKKKTGVDLCAKVMCKNKLYNHKDFRKYSLLNHPDKTAARATDEYKAVAACAKADKFCTQ